MLRELHKDVNVSNQFHTVLYSYQEINTVFDFFNPILKLKYAEEYDSMINDSDFDRNDVYILSELCIEKEVNHKKPLVFIEGLEKLLFKLDYSHFDEETVKKVLRNSYNAPAPIGLGNSILASWHQTGESIVYGTVYNTYSKEYRATLGNFSYLYNAHNFKTIMV
ncbi:MAG: hypothetical protein AABY27_02615 [Pseudomonadota bacterium]